MNKNNKISVIIPIYNTERYLEECLNSILKQSYDLYEVLMINDGSTDNSLDICKKYSKLDKRFITINQENKGVSNARNNGIRKSTGDIILFIDSDDCVEKDLFQKINTNFEDNDLLCFRITYWYKSKRKSYSFGNDIIDNNILKREIFLNDYIGGYLGNKAFSSLIIKENNLYMNENIYYCEDLLFLSNYFDYCKKTKYIDESYYYYRMRKKSVSYSFCNEKNVSILNVYDLLISKFEDNCIYKKKFEYNYIFYYYKLRKIIQEKNIPINENILEKEKIIIKQTNLSSKIKFYLLKMFPLIYLSIVYIKNKTLKKLFD